MKLIAEEVSLFTISLYSDPMRTSSPRLYVAFLAFWALLAGLAVAPLTGFSAAQASSLNDLELFIKDADASANNTSNLMTFKDSEQDSAGNTIVVGMISGTLTLPGGDTVRPERWGNVSQGSQAFMMKLDSDGELVWSMTFGGGNSSFDGISANADKTEFAVSGTLRRGNETVDADAVNMNPLSNTPFEVDAPGQDSRRAVFAVYDTDGLLVGANNDSAWVLPAGTEGFSAERYGDALYVGGKFTYSTCPSGGVNFNVAGATSNSQFADFCGPVSAGNTDGFIAKYDLSSNGDLQWVRVVSNSDDSREGSRFLETDSSGNLYVGLRVDQGSSSRTYSVGPKSDNSFMTVSVEAKRRGMLAKFSSSGEPQWGFGVMGGYGDGSDFEGIHVHGSSVYAFGMLGGGTWDHKGTGPTAVNIATPKSPYAGLVVQYNDAGAYQWHVLTRWDGRPSSDYTESQVDRFSSADSDSDGNIYLSGTYRQNVDFDPSASNTVLTASTHAGRHCVSQQERFIASYDSSGNFRWAKKPGGNKCTASTDRMDTLIHLNGSNEVVAIFEPLYFNYISALRYLLVQPFFVGYGPDTIAPTVASVSSGSLNGSYKAGSTLSLRVNFSEPVVVTGTPQLTLETGATDGVANYVSGSGTSTLTFTYTVAAGDESNDLDYVATNSLNLNGGTIQDLASNTAVLTLAAPGGSGSLSASAAIVLDTDAPSLSSSTPSASATGVVVTDSLTFTFSESIRKGTGNITVYSGATCTTLEQTVSVADARVAASGSTVTLAMADNQLPYQSDICVEVGSGAITDLAGNSYAGLAKPASLEFSTEADPTPPPSPSPSPSPAPSPAPAPAPEPDPAPAPAPRPAAVPTPPAEPPVVSTPARPTTPPAPTPPPAPGAVPAAETPAGPGAVFLRAEEIFEGTIILGTDTEELIMPAFVLQDIATQLAPDGAPLEEGALVIESGSTMIAVLIIQLGDVRLSAADMGNAIQFTLNIPGFESSSMTVAVQKQALVWAFWIQMGLLGLSAAIAVTMVWLFVARNRRRKNDGGPSGQRMNMTPPPPPMRPGGALGI